MPHTALLQAFEKAELGQLQDLRSLVAAQPNLATEADHNGSTLLLAVLASTVSMDSLMLQACVKELLDAGADPEANRLDSDWFSPLHLAIQGNYIEVIEMLLEAGCVLDACGKHPHDMNALECALYTGKTPAAQILASKGAEVDLRLAGGLGWMDIVANTKGHDPATSGHNGAFFYACINGQNTVIEYIIDWGVDVNLQPPGEDFGGISATGLHRAAEHNQREACLTLVRLGARKDLVDDVFGKTPSEWAAFFGHKALAIEIAP
ncbi:MAG: ankyrin repeat domain-containing protein [Pseudomonadota bacterium]